ncbi:SAM-dependent methyltransferase [Candidatus Aerophobetes bacterium]|nr:SAM-dependent methyltransferase [Candidatus Aerophobetes bacterium]
MRGFLNFKIEENKKREIIFYFHKSEKFMFRQRKRAGNIRDYFACRSLRRPDSIGLSTVSLIQKREKQAHGEGFDTINRTAVLDLNQI